MCVPSVRDDCPRCVGMWPCHLFDGHGVVGDLGGVDLRGVPVAATAAGVDAEEEEPQNFSRPIDILDGVSMLAIERVVLPLLVRAGVELALPRGDGVAWPGEEDTRLRDASCK
jgi:hypothetical protein